MRNRLIQVLGLILLCFSVNGQPLSLSLAIQKALENNFSIQIAAKNVEAAAERNSMANAGAFPSLSFSFNAREIYSLDKNPTSYIGNLSGGAAVVGYNISPSIALDWTIFNGFKMHIQRSKLELLEELSSGQKAVVVENTIQAVILSYYNVLLQQEKLMVAKEVMDLSSDRLAAMEIRKSFGSAVTFDVIQEKTSYLSDSTNYVRQQLNTNNASRNLSLVMGEGIETRFLLSDPFITSPKKYILADLKEKMESSNSNLSNQSLNLSLMAKERKIQGSTRSPIISFSSGGNTANSHFTIPVIGERKGSSLDLYANLSLRFNLFNGFQTNSQIQETKILEEITLLETEDLKRNLNDELVRAFETYKAMNTLLDLAIMNEKHSKLNVDMAEERYKAGALNSFDYRIVVLNYLNTSMGAAQASYDLIEANTNLLRLTGGIIQE